MHAYEKRISNLERQTPLFVYHYQIIALSKDGEIAFQGKQLTGEYVFHYEDPEETEEARLEIVKDAALRNLAFQNTPGIRHKDALTKNYLITLKGKPIKARLEPGIDFKIEVGERVLLEPVKKLEFEDIEALSQ